MTVDTPTLLNPPISRRAFEFSRVVRTVGYVAVVSAMAVAVATFFILMGLTPIAPTEAVVLTVLILNGALAAVLVLVIGWEIGSLVLARRRGRAAARLHIRIVALFSIVAATPAILVAVVASVTLDRGLDNWFSTNTKAIVENSANIATALIDAQAQSLDAEITGLEQETRTGARPARREPRPFPELPCRGCARPRPARRLPRQERRLDRRRGGARLAGEFPAAAALGDRSRRRSSPAGRR